MRKQRRRSASRTAKLISAFVFPTRIVQSLYFLNPKFQVSSHYLWLFSPVCVGPGWKPRRPVFSQRGSYEPGYEKTCLQDCQPSKTLTSLLTYRGEQDVWGMETKYVLLSRGRTKKLLVKLSRSGRVPLMFGCSISGHFHDRAHMFLLLVSRVWTNVYY